MTQVSSPNHTHPTRNTHSLAGIIQTKEQNLRILVQETYFKHEVGG